MSRRIASITTEDSRCPWSTRCSTGVSSTKSWPRWVPIPAAVMPVVSSTLACTPTRVLIVWVSGWAAAASSIRRTIPSVRSIGVPTGMFSSMMIVSESDLGMKVNSVRPPVTIPTETMSTATAALRLR